MGNLCSRRNDFLIDDDIYEVPQYGPVLQFESVMKLTSKRPLLKFSVGRRTPFSKLLEYELGVFRLILSFLRIDIIAQNIAPSCKYLYHFAHTDLDVRIVDNMITDCMFPSICYNRIKSASFSFMDGRDIGLMKKWFSRYASHLEELILVDYLKYFPYKSIHSELISLQHLNYLAINERMIPFDTDIIINLSKLPLDHLKLTSRKVVRSIAEIQAPFRMPETAKFKELTLTRVGLDQVSLVCLLNWIKSPTSYIEGLHFHECLFGYENFNIIIDILESVAEKNSLKRLTIPSEIVNHVAIDVNGIPAWVQRLFLSSDATLEMLNIDSTSFGTLKDFVLFNLSKIQNLKSLKVHNIAHNSNIIFDILHPTSKLDVIEVHNSYLVRTSKFMINVLFHPNGVKHAKLHDIKGIDILPKFENRRLQTLHCVDKRFDTDFFRLIAAATFTPALKVLSLDSCRVKDVSGIVAMIPICKNLIELTLTRTSVESLDSWKGIMKEIGDHPRLSKVVLSNSPLPLCELLDLCMMFNNSSLSSVNISRIGTGTTFTELFDILGNACQLIKEHKNLKQFTCTSIAGKLVYESCELLDDLFKDVTNCKIVY